MPSYVKLQMTINSDQPRLSKSSDDGSVNHLTHPIPLSHEFRFGTRGLLILMLLVAILSGFIGLVVHLFRAYG